MLDHRLELVPMGVKRKLGCSIISRIFLLFIVYSCALDVLLDSIVGQLSHPGNLQQLNQFRELNNGHKLSPASKPPANYEASDYHNVNIQDLAGCDAIDSCDHLSTNITIDSCLKDRSIREAGVVKGLWTYPIGLSGAAPEVSEWRHNDLILVEGILEFRRWFGLGALWMPLKAVEAIRLVRLEAPNFIEAGQPVRLRCIYETRGDKLQSLSWYKNGHEFYRYQPFERRQPVLAFNYTGITVDLTKSRNSTVFLTNTTSETSGRYKCEATATNFQEVNMETYVTIVTPSSDSAILSNCPSLINYVILSSLLAIISYSSRLSHH